MNCEESPPRPRAGAAPATMPEIMRAHPHKGLSNENNVVNGTMMVRYGGGKLCKR
jgi:hypothetical protein